jgi:hypothetical protein
MTTRTRKPAATKPAAAKPAAAKPAAAKRTRRLAVVPPLETDAGRDKAADAAVAAAAIDRDDEIAAMDRATRTAAALAEAKTYKAWRDAGEQGDAPATPVRDWIAAHPKGTPTPKSSRSTKYDDTVSVELVDIVKNARQTGVSFPKLAVELNAKTYQGHSDWTGPKLYAFACRHDVGKLPLVKSTYGEPI